GDQGSGERVGLLGAADRGQAGVGTQLHAIDRRPALGIVASLEGLGVDAAGLARPAARRVGGDADALLSAAIRDPGGAEFAADLVAVHLGSGQAVATHDGVLVEAALVVPATGVAGLIQARRRGSFANLDDQRGG